MWKKRIAWIGAGLLALVLVTGIAFEQRIRQVFFVKSLFSGEEMVDTFRNLDRIFPVAEVKRGDTCFHFGKREWQLPTTYTFDGKRKEVASLLKDVDVTGLLVIQNDAVLYEQYFLGNTEATRWVSWSVAKPMVGALVGIAVADGAIASVNDPITQYVPELEGTGYDGVRIKDILQMSSGVRYNENYSDPNSDVNVMARTLALGGSFDGFMTTLRREYEPGTHYQYKSMDTQALGMLLVRATGKSVSAYLEEKLWKPLGMEYDSFFLCDRSGMELAFCGVNATVRDYAKFGRLYLNRGNWEGKQIIPESWVQDTLTPDSPHLIPGNGPGSPTTMSYGYQMQLPPNTDGAFLMRGVYGQHIYVAPAKKAIVVMTAANHRFGAYGGGEANDRTEEQLAMIQSLVAALD